MVYKSMIIFVSLPEMSLKEWNEGQEISIMERRTRWRREKNERYDLRVKMSRSKIILIQEMSAQDRVLGEGGKELGHVNELVIQFDCELDEIEVRSQMEIFKKVSLNQVMFCD